MYEHDIKAHLSDYIDPEDPADYMTPDGLSWGADPGDLILGGLVKFCCCGLPEQDLAFIRGAMLLLQRRRGQPEKYAEFSAWWDKEKEAERAHFGNEASASFFWKWLDEAGFAEHGSSVPGWLTPKGEALLNLLNEWEEQRPEEDAPEPPPHTGEAGGGVE